MKASLTILLALLCVFALNAWENDTELSHWMQDYYKNPEPDRITDVLNYVHSNMTLETHNFANLAAFLGATAAENRYLFQENDFNFDISSLPEWNKISVFLTLSYSGFSENQELKNILLNNEKEQFRQDYSKIERMLLNPQKLKVYIETRNKYEDLIHLKNPDFWSWQFDVLFAHFFATGDTGYIYQIIKIMDEISKSKGTTPQMQGTLMYSGFFGLRGNAIRDNTILQLIKEEKENTTYTAFTRDALEKAYNKAVEVRKIRNNN